MNEVPFSNAINEHVPKQPFSSQWDLALRKEGIGMLTSSESHSKGIIIVIMHKSWFDWRGYFNAMIHICETFRDGQ